MKYPETRLGDSIDTYHGTDVPDPYRWLEKIDTPETREWIDAQNALTQSWLEGAPGREGLRRRIESLWAHDRWSLPSEHGGRWFTLFHEAHRDQPVLRVANGPREEGRTLLDPHPMSTDGTVSLGPTSPSPNGKLVAYGVSQGGSDWHTWRVRDVDSGEDYPEVLEWVKFSNASWLRDSSGFFYSRYDVPDDAFNDVNLHQRVWFHRVGTSQDDDILVYERDDAPRWGFSADVTDDGTRIILSVWEGTDPRSRLLVLEIDALDLSRPGTRLRPNALPLLNAFDAKYTHITSNGAIHWVHTNHSAPRGRVIRLDERQTSREHWVEIIPEGEHVIESVTRVGDQLIVTRLVHAHTEVTQYTLDGERVRSVPLPGIGTAWGFDGRSSSSSTTFGYASFDRPPTIYQYDTNTGEHSVLWKPDVPFDPDMFVVRQIRYRSNDGTEVPMFLVHRRDRPPTPETPTLLYGYGGFHLSITPSFSVSGLVWMEMGGLYALANLRGGGEYGQTWHEAGTRMNKQQVFDDFICAGEWLIDQGYTCRERLVIEGRSNGGLLVGACLTQRPDLFGAALPGVGVLDMLRYHRFTIGWAWASDYGTAEESPEMFSYLLNYSPLHNARHGTHYPATLIMTGDHDDRVVPAHSFKFAAAMQAAQTGSAPVLLRVETRAGHGQGTPTSLLIDDLVDKWSFILRALALPAPYPDALSS